jgi:predicted RNase H-like HicB family nuclease
MDKQTVEVDVHRDASGYWAQVQGLDGCLASGMTLDELVAAVSEALAVYLGEETDERLLTRVVALRLAVEPDLRSAGPIRTVPPSGRRRSSVLKV